MASGKPEANHNGLPNIDLTTVTYEQLEPYRIAAALNKRSVYVWCYNGRLISSIRPPTNPYPNTYFIVTKSGQAWLTIAEGED